MLSTLIWIAGSMMRSFFNVAPGAAGTSRGTEAGGASVRSGRKATLSPSFFRNAAFECRF
ncbi:hypothetical protein C5689_04425 [Methylosinus sporium]|uniref:Uncharacterized protein n=1 Tax=Methylosinus sporium TaxID=428 RepID=A0A2U1STU8_METSR|nr:hypothetical protein C5689_04425 [Methylosinus sporium]